MATTRTQLSEQPRDEFWEMTEKQLNSFERKEAEFRKKVRKERAEDLQIQLEQDNRQFRGK